MLPSPNLGQIYLMKRWEASNTNVTKMSPGCENEVKVPKLVTIHPVTMTEAAFQNHSQNSALRIWVQLLSILFESPFKSMPRCCFSVGESQQCAILACKAGYFLI